MVLFKSTLLILIENIIEFTFTPSSDFKLSINFGISSLRTRFSLSRDVRPANKLNL